LIEEIIAVNKVGGCLIGDIPLRRLMA